jgi:membrane protein implicated in regulation of membrane protease activity
MIFLLEIFLQSSVILILAALAFWVLLLVLLTSPLWIPLSICWAPAALLTYLVFRYTKVRIQKNDLSDVKAGEKAMDGAERLFYYLLERQLWLRKPFWKNIYSVFSW